jgi:hypothetical protein
MGLGDANILGFQFFDAVWLAFERYHTEIVAIEEREHMPMYIEHQHITSISKCRERQFLLHVIAQRKAKLAIVFYVHG